MESDKTFLSRIIKEMDDARHDQRITIKDLAEASGLDRTYVSDIFRGRRTPSICVIYRMCCALSISTLDLRKPTKNRK